MAQLTTIEKAIRDYISHQGGQFTVQQSEALRAVFEAIVDEIEEIKEEIAE